MLRLLDLRERLPIAVKGLETQPYDPDIAALDSGGMIITRERLTRGFGAPPVVPYAQILGEGGLGIRARILDWIKTFAPEPVFPKFRELLQPPETAP